MATDENQDTERPPPATGSVAHEASAADELAAVRYDAAGLVPAIAQDRATGKVLMMAWMTPATLRRTLETGRMVYWSRSRQEEWAKGDTSGDRQWVREAWYDCDGDTLLFVVDQEGGGACHTGELTCFHRSLPLPPSRASALPDDLASSQ